ALQDLYQKMLVTDLEYALDKKVEQDLWNHAFKNQITTLQSQAKNRANPNRSEVQANLSLFLEAASGFYTQLLQELCTVFNVDLPCRVKSSQLGIISNKQSSSSAIVTPQPSSCSYICQHCLVHLGDIVSQDSLVKLIWPYNQLAILASSKGDHLTTIFYYCRSIAVKFPFPAASTNLQKALSKALESRDEVKTKWSVSDFIKAFIKFHGHVYLSKSLDKLDPLREKLEEQFQRLILQKAFSSQQLVHITVINLFELHHLRDLRDLRDLTADGGEQSFSGEQQISWFQLLGLFMSFLGVMCSRVLLNKNRGEEVMGECPLPAVKLSLDWLRLRPSVFQEPAVENRKHIWAWLVSILNSFQPKEDDVSCSSAMPLPEEFELQGFLALRPALRCLDFTKGHQGILVDRDGLPVPARHQRLIGLGKWVADNQPGLIRCQVNEDGLLIFITDIPEEAIEEPQDKEAPVLQESSNGEQTQNDGGNSGLKSVLSAGKTQSSWADSSDRPVVTFKENIKPREQSREPPRNHLQKDSSKERRDFLKGNGAAAGKELKKDGKRKTEMKKSAHEKTVDPGKQVKVQAELRKTPVSEAKKTPVTQTQTTCSSQFIPIHHPGAFPPLPSRPSFPPSAYVIQSPVAFPGLQVNPGFTFSTGVSVPGPFLQAGTQVQAGKQSHIPYSQQRPSGPGSSGPGPMNQVLPQAQQQPGQPSPQQALQQSVQLQVQALSQQQQSPTKPVQQVGLGKSPPHHPGLQQQFMQVQDQPAQMWTQAQAALQKMSPLQMSMKQPQQQQFYIGAQDSLKPYEHQLQPPISNMDKKMKFPDVKMQDFYWDSFMMGDSLALMAERMKRPPPGGLCAEQEGPAGLRGPTFENLQNLQNLHLHLSGVKSSSFCFQEYNQNSIFSQAYGKNLPPSSKPDVPMMQQEPSLYSLFEGTPWSPSLPASSDHSTPASQSPHSSNPSSLPSSPPTHNHGTVPFSNFGPIGTPDSRDRRVVDRWKAEKPGTFGLDFLPAAASSTPSDTSWHQAGSAASSWTNQESPMDESSSTVLLDSLKSIWSSSMMQPGPSALEQLLLQQKQKQQRGHGAMNPPH
uniref:Nonsense-mediated mRNA decay factor n=1 Tax=Kryptolebias marmoratus TaxID=37003 RepID=A0A3Q2ZRN5_KRYMA